MNHRQTCPLRCQGWGQGPVTRGQCDRGSLGERGRGGGCYRSRGGGGGVQKDGDFSLLLFGQLPDNKLWYFELIGVKLCL